MVSEICLCVTKKEYYETCGNDNVQPLKCTRHRIVNLDNHTPGIFPKLQTTNYFRSGNMSYMFESVAGIVSYSIDIVSRIGDFNWYRYQSKTTAGIGGIEHT